MMAPRQQPSPTPIMTPPRPQLDSSEEYVNFSQSLTLSKESSLISSTQVYYKKQYSKYKNKKLETKSLALTLTYQHFTQWQKKRGVDKANSHLTRNEFQVLKICLCESFVYVNILKYVNIRKYVNICDVYGFEYYVMSYHITSYTHTHTYTNINIY